MLFQLVFDVMVQSNPFWEIRPLPSFLVSFSFSAMTSSQDFGVSFIGSRPASFQRRLFMMKSWAFNWLAAPFSLPWYDMPGGRALHKRLVDRSSWVA